MPPMHLRHGCRNCLRCCSNTWTEVVGNIGHISLYSRWAKLTRVQLRRHAGGKSSAMALVAGGACSHSSEK